MTDTNIASSIFGSKSPEICCNKKTDPLMIISCLTAGVIGPPNLIFMLL
jgi:hypothetical protein